MDPYTFHETASDDRFPAPWWRILLVLCEPVALLVAIWFVWHRRFGTAVAVAIGEALFNVTLVFLEVRADGITRFVAGYDAHEYLSWYLPTLLLRLALIGVLVFAFTYTKARDPATP